jgi:hypothetical protein
MKRRDVIKLSGGAIAAAVRCKRPRRKKKVIVMGAGIAGLSCAYELVRRGHQVTVIEATGRAGGHVRTFHDQFADGQSPAQDGLSKPNFTPPHSKPSISLIYSLTINTTLLLPLSNIPFLHFFPLHITFLNPLHHYPSYPKYSNFLIHQNLTYSLISSSPFENTLSQFFQSPPPPPLKE